MDAKGYERLYKKIRRMFDGVTPLKRDCGAVCGGACCRGDESRGMRLFPHETTPLRTVENDGARYAVCGGACDRAARPLACRIFPLFPAADERGRISAVVDARACAVCPLARHWDEIAFDRRFPRRVKKAGRLLAKDAACRAFLRETAREIADAAALAALLLDDEQPPQGESASGPAGF